MHAPLRHIVLAILYAVALWTPAVHDHFLEDEACGDCEAILAAGPQFTLPCDASGPCESGHHHHHGQVHGQCLSCHALSVVGLPVAGGWTPSAAVDAVGELECDGATPTRTRPPGTHRARAPPAVS